MYHAKPSVYVIVVQLLVDGDRRTRSKDRDLSQNILDDIQKVLRLNHVHAEKNHVFAGNPQ